MHINLCAGTDRQFSVPVLPDTLDLADETVNLTLRNPDYASLDDTGQKPC